MSPFIDTMEYFIQYLTDPTCSCMRLMYWIWWSNIALAWRIRLHLRRQHVKTRRCTRARTITNNSTGNNNDLDSLATGNVVRNPLGVWTRTGGDPATYALCKLCPCPGYQHCPRCHPWFCVFMIKNPTVRRTRLSTFGDRAFPVAAARTWNSLPQHVTSAPSMPVFRGRLKAFLFRRSFPWLVT